ncbi:MAG: sugar phosphate isomerase/epimerase [Caldilineaceae bacterium SB0665_bin_21]|nr:sugar phosphate isomerase/epimerase [Caldilineaceae bacterium SB0665_bin_21]MYA05307.1 sugar phosphate isomerase/epimerase [Caldilineaceae bacterium SB0664_bin_22]MYC61993.1 sugar phosphate isomerase/epimerase [Caldilineaceae bacterium SB0661_bin_34]
MYLSLSVRVAESFTNKRISTVPLADIATTANEAGYRALCMRASVVGMADAPSRQTEVLATVKRTGLSVSMVTPDFAVPENSPEGPGVLRNIEPALDLCERLECDLIRVCLKEQSDIEAARLASDKARERGIRLAHQCHTQSLFETIEGCLDVCSRVDRPNFGLIYEPANLVLCGEPYGSEAIERLAEVIFNVYLQNHTPDPQGTLMMDTWSQGRIPTTLHRFTDPGGIDMPAVILGLEGIDYTGSVTLHHTQLDVVSPLEAAADSAGFLLNLMASG